MTEITNKVAPCHYVLSYVPKTMKALWEKLCGFSKVFPTNFISAILSANVCTSCFHSCQKYNHKFLPKL